jgi:5,10-methylenetetrahydromethanopterin reductase
MMAPMSIDFWTSTGNTRGQASTLATDAERAGFDGITFSDTQCSTADPIVGLAVAARATESIGLGLGVTNSVTRHPSVLAASMATLQLESHGRAVLGIGRGDSAVTKVGLTATPATEFEDYLRRLQGYLSGSVVGQDGPLARLAWLEELSIPKVPVDVAATGPKMVAIGARQAERVTFNVGADVVRVAQNIELAREARRGAGLDPDHLSLGLYVNVAPLDDSAAARELVKPVVAVYARFSGMGGTPVDGVQGRDAAVIEAVASNYDMAHHGRSDASHLAYLDDDFVDRFSIAGTPEHCIRRFTELSTLGIERFLVVGPANDGNPEYVAESRRLLAEVVLPGVRAAINQR